MAEYTVKILTNPPPCKHQRIQVWSDDKMMHETSVHPAQYDEREVGEGIIPVIVNEVKTILAKKELSFPQAKVEIENKVFSI